MKEHYYWTDFCKLIGNRFVENIVLHEKNEIAVQGIKQINLTLAG